MCDHLQGPHSGRLNTHLKSSFKVVAELGRFFLPESRTLAVDCTKAQC